MQIVLEWCSPRESPPMQDESQERLEAVDRGGLKHVTNMMYRHQSSGNFDKFLKAKEDFQMKISSSIGQWCHQNGKRIQHMYRHYLR